MARPGRRARILAIGGSTLAVLAAAVLALADVDTALDGADRRAIASLGLDAACAERTTYEDDVACVRALQAKLLEVVPDVRCVHVWGEVSHEPAALLERGRGCCYDRSRLIEKTLASYGFEVRHLSIHKLRLPAPFGYLQNVPSHAISEVRTRRGFMVVDSNRPWIARTPDGAPLDARALRDALRSGAALEAPEIGDYFGGDYAVFYGLYSRHGGFYPPFVPVPDVDVAQLGHNFGS